MNEDSLLTETSATELAAATSDHEVVSEKVPRTRTPRKAKKTTRRSPTPPNGGQPSAGQPEITERWMDYLLHQAQCLLQTKQAQIAQQQAEIAQKQAEAELLQKLIEAAQGSGQEKPDMTPQLEEAQQQIIGLQSANAQLQTQLEDVERQLAGATETTKLLRLEVENLRSEIEIEKSARLGERKDFGEQIEREIRYEVEGFKGKLAGKLKPLFEQSDSARAQPANGELAEFLCGLFQDLEEKLAEADVFVSRGRS
jgi:hypothetical protein